MTRQGASAIDLLNAGLLERLLPGAVPIEPQAIELAPATTGAYLLVLRLASPAEFHRGGARHTLSPGCFAYAGSAHGPGGLRARLRRHFRREKRLHWHVDQLTRVAAQMQALAIEGGRECEIVDRLIGSRAFEIALPGFGSSDCRRCSAHLLAWRGCPPAD